MPIALIIDDSDDDAFLLRHAFAQSAPGTRVLQLNSGEEAVKYFSERLPEHPIPNLILTDLKMPGIGGFGLLEWLRAQPPFNTLPVVMLSSSDDEQDILRAKQLGVEEFITKPADFSGYLSLVPKIHDRWLGGARSAAEREIS